MLILADEFETRTPRGTNYTAVVSPFKSLHESCSSSLHSHHPSRAYHPTQLDSWNESQICNHISSVDYLRVGTYLGNSYKDDGDLRGWSSVCGCHGRIRLWQRSYWTVKRPSQLASVSKNEKGKEMGLWIVLNHARSQHHAL